MKQGIRFFLKPSSFVTQLQWSSHHPWILAVFFLSALVETQLGPQGPVYAKLAVIFARDAALPLGLSIWILTFIKLAFLGVGAWFLTETIFFLGSLFGQPTSRRVLFRRLAIVFSLILLGQSALGLSESLPYAALLAGGFWIWALLLGFYTLREGFRLNGYEASAVGIFVLFLALGVWNFMSLSLQRVARAAGPTPTVQIAKKPGAPRQPRFRPFFK